MEELGRKAVRPPDIAVRKAVAVLLVADDRIASRCEMGADLMGPPGHELDLDERKGLALRLSVHAERRFELFERSRDRLHSLPGFILLRKHPDGVRPFVLLHPVREAELL